MQTLILGDSSLTALKQADGRIGQGRHSIQFAPLGPAMELLDPFWTDHGTHAVITVQSRKTPQITVPDPKRPGMALGLGMALWPTRLVRALAVDDFSLPHLGQGRLLSWAQFRLMVLDDMQHSLSLAHAAVRLNLRPYAIEPPGLFRAHPLFSARPADLVLGLRAAYLRVAREALGAAGVPILRAPDTGPDSVFDADGFMLDIYRHPDPKDTHHANDAFGEIMMKRVHAHLDQLDRDTQDRNIA